MRRAAGEGEEEEQVTVLLHRVHEGDDAAREELLPLVYDELRRVAAVHMNRQPPGHTLQATALVHEAYMRLLPERERTWRSRRHFMAYAASAIRSILVDHARAKQADKRPPADKRLPLDSLREALEARSHSLPDLDAALEKLAAFDPRAVQVVELRFFAGFEVKEVAEILEISESTVVREWRSARAWLRTEIADGR